MDSKKSIPGAIEKKNSVRAIFYNYLKFLWNGSRMGFNLVKWAVYNFGMHGVILLGTN